MELMKRMETDLLSFVLGPWSFILCLLSPSIINTKLIFRVIQLGAFPFTVYNYMNKA